MFRIIKRKDKYVIQALRSDQYLNQLGPSTSFGNWYDVCSKDTLDEARKERKRLEHGLSVGEEFVE